MPAPAGRSAAALASFLRYAMDMDKTMASPDRLLADGDALPPGSQLGKYEIEKMLAEGGMGRVYVGRHRDLQSKHAIKVVLKSLADDPKFISRFRREARIMAALDHTNIVRVTDFGEESGVPYYVMEFVGGEGGAVRTLEDELLDGVRSGRQKGLDERRVKELVLQICESLQYAHKFGREGVAHLDLKPANIMLTQVPSSKGEKTLVKVTDFGLARLLDPQSPLMSMVSTTSPGSEATRMIAGTPRYMSPEQWKGDPDVGPASDIYSMGKIIYEMLTGMVPQDLYQPPPPSSVGCSPDWDIVVKRCLAPEPRERYKSAAHLAAAVERVDLDWQRKRSRRRGSRAPAVVLVLLLAAAGGLFAAV